MNAHTRLSAKGQVVIPKGVRDLHDWCPGTELEVVDRPDGVLLRRRDEGLRRITYEEFKARNPAHDGPPISVEEMKDGAMQAVRESWASRGE